ncbi:SOS response-associated peptidase [Niveispirillum sp. KHB5.9]|uniref:SOS response-associated peptidase n=1 Tax=Niveispirillum sp. KHB5.9 TaxID=3400269 RepID=UPI003A8817FA
MCGRFVQKSLEDMAAGFGATLRADMAPRHLVARYNIAPTAEIGVIGLDRAGARSMIAMRWGLVPSWANDASGAARMINARSESAADKPSFRESWQKRRAIIPADGFYEWPQTGDRKQPWYVARADGGPMAFAALWDVWRGGGDGPLFTCCILTAPANDELARIHERTPVMLMDEGAIERWLSPATPEIARHGLMRAPATGALTLRPVTPLVNAVRHDGPELLDDYQPETAIPAKAVGSLL